MRPWTEVAGAGAALSGSAASGAGLSESEAVVPDDERELWAESEEVDRELVEAGRFVDDGKLAAYLDEVLTAILPETLPPFVPRPVVRVVIEPRRVASILANGRVYVSSGLLSALENEAQLAALLGHEVAHFLARDSLRTKRFAEINHSTVERMEVERSYETTADRRAAELAHAVGYDPREALHTLEIVGEEDAAARGTVYAWESHPTIRQRRSSLAFWIRRLPENARRIEADRYAAAVHELRLATAVEELEAGWLERARETVDRILEARPGSGRGHALRAAWLRRTELEGPFAPKVLEAWEQAYALAPDEPSVVRGLALLRVDRDESARAQPLLRRYLELAPDAFDRRLIERYLVEEEDAATDADAAVEEHAAGESDAVAER